jgi:hypothetical protein
MRPAGSYSSCLEYIQLKASSFPEFGKIAFNSVNVCKDYSETNLIINKDFLISISMNLNHALDPISKMKLSYLKISDVTLRTRELIEQDRKSVQLVAQTIDQRMFKRISQLKYYKDKSIICTSCLSDYIIVTVMAKNMGLNGEDFNGCFQHMTWLYSWQSINQCTADKAISGIQPLSFISDIDIRIDDRDSADKKALTELLPVTSRRQAIWAMSWPIKPPAIRIVAAVKDKLTTLGYFGRRHQMLRSMINLLGDDMEFQLLALDSMPGFLVLGRIALGCRPNRGSRATCKIAWLHLK